MSLGFLTESALLPSKAKRIEVDGKSLLDLKAVVFEKEQQQAAAAPSISLRHKRGRHAAASVTAASSRGVFSRPNKGVAERQAADERARLAQNKKKQSAAALEKKAKLYDQLKSGAIADPDKHGFLVAFSGKAPEDDGGGGGGGGEEATQDLASTSDGEVEIEDEFGRARVVTKRSREFAEYEARKQARTAEPLSPARPQQQWPVSSGHSRADCGDWQRPDDRSSGKGMADFAGQRDVDGGWGGGGGDGEDGGPRPLRGYVKSRWEVTLNAEEKEYLRDIHEETAASRMSAKGKGNGAADRADAKFERRELLRAKLEARKAKQRKK